MPVGTLPRVSGQGGANTYAHTTPERAVISSETGIDCGPLVFDEKRDAVWEEGMKRRTQDL